MREKVDAENSTENIEEKESLIKVTEGVLFDTCTDISKAHSFSMPITELAALGIGVSSLLPAIRTVTQTTIDMKGLYYLANESIGDTLKIAKNGNFWGAFRTADGTSKFAQLQAANPFSVTNSTVEAVNPAFMLMAVALFSIEQKLKHIEEMDRQILDFLRTEKQAEMESDTEALFEIIQQYKNNWDNEHFINSNHKLVLDIKRTARKNIHFYQKEIIQVFSSKQGVILAKKAESIFFEMEKRFRYYRLSLYTFSMASLIEIMLSGNFREENIDDVKGKIEEHSIEYRELFTKCSAYLEKMSVSAMDKKAIQKVGMASKTVGEVIGNIPIVKRGIVDEILQEKGDKLQKNANEIEQEIVRRFKKFSNPETKVFTDKMEDIIQIYNHTSKICFDQNRIYLMLDGYSLGRE